ncbi:hypothetical protein V500_06615 [Pseudogymnoascus sp. VKM F-4518 (FW-2643)]|nr:hypothetical protein V500_06615 [Pseudogymnoascus sp. VKM F-4518 (FW-2643)]
MEKLKSILSPGKHVEDEILYGSGGGGQYEHTGREAPGSTGGYYGGTGSQSQIYNRESDSIPSQPSTAQEYGKTEEYAQAEQERASKAKVAREQSAQEKEAFYRQGEEKTTREKQNGHKKQRSGEHKESRNPYTQQAVDPRLGEGSEESKAARSSQPQAYAAGYAPTDTARTAQGYEGEGAAGRGGNGAAAGLAGAAGAAGVAGAAGRSSQGYSGTTAAQQDSPPGEVVGRTVSGNHLVERTASGQYRTRLASIIDPKNGGGVKTSESAYEHTPGGGGAYTADKFHQRESRVASVTLPDGKKYTDPEAADSYGLPSGVGYKAPAGSGYEQGSYGGQGQPQVATTKSEAANAVGGDQTSHRGAGAVGAGVAGAAVAGAGYEGTKTARAQPEETTSKTTNHKADKAAKKSASKAVPAQRADEAAYAAPVQTKTAQPVAAKYGDVDVPPGNDYGKGVKDPRYGFPMSAAGISAEEAAALRRNEVNMAQPTAANQAYAAQPHVQDQAYAARPSVLEQPYATQPTAANQAYATQPTEHAAKSTEEKKPSRRSSILGFLHLGKDKDKKRHSKDEKKHSKDEKRLSDQQRQPYTDRTGQTPLGSVAGAGFGGQQSSVPGSTAGHGQTSDLAYRDRMASTADAPPFVGGLVAPNGAPLKGPSASNADSSAWAKSTEKEVMDKGGMGQGSYGGGAANQAAYGGGGGAANQAAYGGTGTANQAASGTGIDETYPNEPTTGTAGTGATQGGTTAQKSDSQGAATTGGAIAAGAAAGGLAAGGARGSQANQGVASDYNMQSAQDKGAPTADHLYDQVSPRSSAANKKAQETSHGSNGSKETKSNQKSHGHKEKNNTAYAGSDVQTRDAAYGGNGNNAQAGNAAQGGNPPAYGNGAESNAAAYGGKETRASNAAYGNEAQSTSNAGYGDKAVNADEAAFGDEAYVGGEGSGVSRQGTTKVAERAGHHVLHKDPPASHPAAAMAGAE